jgi:hydrogenase expression/formation protein HypE
VYGKSILQTHAGGFFGMKNSLPVGKLYPDLLGSLFASYHIDDPTVIIGPEVGEDAAVIDLGDTYLVAKTDPITFATDEIGWYLVCVNGNDIATMGAEPRWLLATLLLPERERYIFADNRSL